MLEFVLVIPTIPSYTLSELQECILPHVSKEQYALCMICDKKYQILVSYHMDFTTFRSVSMQ